MRLSRQQSLIHLCTSKSSKNVPMHIEVILKKAQVLTCHIDSTGSECLDLQL